MENVTKALLAELRAAGYSWYRIARLLGVSDQSVTTWKNGGRMSDDPAVRACAILKKSPRDLAAILAALAVERASNAETRAAWAHVLKRLGGLAAGVALAIGAGGPTPPSGGAAVAAENGALAVYYVKRRRQLHSARGWLDSLTGTLRRLAASLAPFPGVFAS